MISVNFIPKTDIEEYLNNDFNVKIYNTLGIGRFKEHEDKLLEFFNLLYEQFEMVNANKEKPLSVTEHLQNLELETEERMFNYLRYYLVKLIYVKAGMQPKGEPTDKPLAICHDFIKKEFDREQFVSSTENKTENKDTEPIQAPTSKPLLGQYTNSQLVLIFYYFFKQNGLEPRVGIDISPIAKFIHLITGKEFKTVTNSDFYKKLQTVPNFKKDKGLINDLETIKPLFKRVQLNEVVKLIENEIEIARNEMKPARAGTGGQVKKK